MEESLTTKRIQNALKKEGFYQGSIDGKYGPATTRAMNDWKEFSITLPKGIDISKWQTSVDYQELKKNDVAFAFIKATDGINVDPLFKKHWEGMGNAGIIRGVYHFYRQHLDPIAQAKHIVQTIGSLPQGCLPVALDVERNGKGKDGIENTKDDAVVRKSDVSLCLKTIEHLTGKRPFVYSYGPFLKSYKLDFPDYPLWIADYRSGPPTIPLSWKQYTIHQYIGDKGIQVGVKGPCDLNRFRGTLTDLHRLANI